MTPHLDDGDVRVYVGDCVEVMRELPESSVDAVVTDPPYALPGGFMGKEWDRLGRRPAEWHRAWATEALRVAKPGAHLLAFGGPRTFHRLACGIEDAGWEVRDCLAWLYGSGFPKSLNMDGGLGTALKPAWEPVVLARKPLAGTVAANVAEHGTGALNIDGCRIDGAGDAPMKWSKPRGGIWSTDSDARGELQENPLGRWPANVALDAEAAAMLDEQAGERGGRAPSSGPSLRDPSGPSNAFGARRGLPPDCEPPFYGDTGGPSRFFYTAKASRSERDGATHPTVKPRDLMRWLVRLVTPPEGLVLDPFGGSGTTGLACRDEGMRCILIEREREYAKEAAHRLRQLSLLGAT